MSYGGKFALPAGTMRELNDVSQPSDTADKTYEEVIIPHSRPIPPRHSERPVKINDLPPMAKGCFPVGQTLCTLMTEICYVESDAECCPAHRDEHE
jgi:antiviral helicase SLH1